MTVRSVRNCSDFAPTKQQNHDLMMWAMGVWCIFMMTSSNGNIYHVTGPLCREFTFTKASDMELWCFLWSAAWINGWVNNHEPGDLRCHHAHYDIIVMLVLWINCLSMCTWRCWNSPMLMWIFYVAFPESFRLTHWPMGDVLTILKV